MSVSNRPEPAAEEYRNELILYCYRYFGSYAEAEDAAQETMVRAWSHTADFEGRASLRTWLYRIATNICLDMKRAPQRRCLPMGLTAAGHVPTDPRTLRTRPEPTWIGPIADARLAPAPSDPADAAVLRESVRLAFVAALQFLPPRQRAVLILRDVLAWSSAECADLLGLSVAAVNSALGRARRTMSTLDPAADPAADPALDPALGPPAAADDEKLLSDYIAAFTAYDVERLVDLLAEDAVFSMPPYELWLQGRRDVERWWRGPGEVCRNARTIGTHANGQPAVAVYHSVAAGRWEPFAIHVLDTANSAITAITHFIGDTVFAQFDLPAEIVEPDDPMQ